MCGIIVFEREIGMMTEEYLHGLLQDMTTEEK